MQEAGVPVTFGYISDAHDFHGVSGNDHVAYGPGEAGYVQQLKDYDTGVRRVLHRASRTTASRRTTRSSSSPSRRATTSPAPRPTRPCDGVTHAVHVRQRPRHRGERRPAPARRDLQREPRHERDAPTSASTPTWRRTSTSRATRPATRRRHATSRRRIADMKVDEPAHGHRSRACSSRWPTRSRRSSSTWSRPTRRGRRRSRRSRRATTSSTRRRRHDAVRTNNDLSQLRLPARTTTPPNQTFAWNHGGIQPEVATTWVGMVGPGVEKSGSPATSFWSDHTDIRPTMLALLGLKDDYVSDGRVADRDPRRATRCPKSLQRTARSRSSARPTSRSRRRSGSSRWTR